MCFVRWSQQSAARLFLTSVCYLAGVRGTQMSVSLNALTRKCKNSSHLVSVGLLKCNDMNSKQCWKEQMYCLSLEKSMSSLPLGVLSVKTTSNKIDGLMMLCCSVRSCCFDVSKSPLPTSLLTLWSIIWQSPSYDDRWPSLWIQSWICLGSNIVGNILDNV